MAKEPNDHKNNIFGQGFETCPETGRPYEVGSGALPNEEQTANFVRERDWRADLPKPGETCPQTGRAFECGSGAHTKTMQTERFLSELPPGERARRKANAQALFAATPAGIA